MSETPPPADPATPSERATSPGGSAATTSDERTMAMLAHLLGIFTWFLGPLLIWLLKKDQSAFVNDQGKEALNFQLTVGVAYLGLIVLSCVTLGLGLLLWPLIWIPAIIFCIIAAVAANRGEMYRYPVAIRLVK